MCIRDSTRTAPTAPEPRLHRSFSYAFGHPIVSFGQVSHLLAPCHAKSRCIILATSPGPGSLDRMDGPLFALGRTLVVAAFIAGGAMSRPALAGPEQLSYREQTACMKHRKAKQHALAAEHCLAAYNALPDLPDAMEARSVMAFDAHYSFRDAYAQTGEVKHLCGEIRLFIRFLNYLDQHYPAPQRSDDLRGGAESLADPLRAL